MNIKLRKRELKEKGRFALYLDIYAYGRQWQENLKLYLENDKGNPTLRQMNKQTMSVAEKIKVEKLFLIQNDVFGFKQPEKNYRTFNEFFYELWQERERTGINFDSWDSVSKHLNNFNENIPFTHLTERYLEEFKAYLLTKVKNNTASQYFNIMKHAVHEAFRRKLLREDPVERVKSVKKVDTKREFLTKGEIESLIQTECRYDVLKQAFLFSCFTGLRWSDVNKLVWTEIRIIDEVHYIAFTQKKTKNSELLPISEAAVKLLGERKEDEDRVLTGLRYSDYMNTALLQWCLRAGITKHITFHCTRHTNAILLLNNGVDIFTVSKMLGHKDLKTTSIYAKVMNETKIEAVKKLPEFNI